MKFQALNKFQLTYNGVHEIPKDRHDSKQDGKVGHDTDTSKVSDIPNQCKQEENKNW